MEGFGRGGEAGVEESGIKPVVIREICKPAEKHSINREILMEKEQR